MTTPHEELKDRIENAALLAEIEALREALGWFVADERFQIAVGGNPQVVERMIEQARQVYAASIKQEQEG